MNTVKTAYILMGIPGSGKTRWAAARESPIVSADVWMDTVYLGYLFEPQELVHAHAACFEQFIQHLQEGTTDDVVVDNTNTTLVEISPYIQACRALGARPVVVHIDCDPKVAAQRNVHGVPEQSIQVMYARLKMTLESWPPFWPKPITVKGDEK